MNANGTGRAFGMGRLLLALATGVLLGACGGGGGGSGDGSGSISQPRFGDYSDGLGANEAIGIAFGGPVRKSTLEFRGDLAEVAQRGALDWRSDRRGVTITPAPDEFWPIGNEKSLTVLATTDGGEQQQASENFRVILKFGEAVFTVLQPVVVGQTSFEDRDNTSVFTNPIGNPAYLTPSTPNGEKRIYFPDTGGHRVLVLDGIPGGDQELDTDAAFTAILDAPGFNMPTSVVASHDARRLLVVDSGNHRIIAYESNSAPAGDNPPAGTILGSGDPDVCDYDSFDSPASAFIVPGSGELIVADTGNHRVLIYSHVPSSGGTLPENPIVIGQEGLGAGNCAANRGDPSPTDDTLSSPVGVWSDGTQLVITDRGNERALIWKTFPTRSGQPASFSLDVPNPTPGVTVTQSMQLFISTNAELEADGTVTEPARVLVWNEFPQSGDDEWNAALTAGDDSARQKFRAGGLLLVEDRLVLGQPDNNRYLIFQSQ